jgi:hypothetical protein
VGPGVIIGNNVKLQNYAVVYVPTLLGRAHGSACGVSTMNLVTYV